MDQTVYLLWTGGWDSTYRLVELSRMDVTVQPLYCRDPERPSTAIEEQTMTRILEALAARPETRATLCPVQTLERADIPADPEITAAYRRLAAEGTLGSQYDFLARLSRVYPGLELGIEKANHEKSSGCRATILKHGAFREENGCQVLDKEHSSQDCIAVMGHFRFPIIHITENEMVENIRAWGYEDIMAKIWFCHTPIGNQPCGMCSPCCQKMEGAMEFLLPEAAAKRYRIYKKTANIFGKRPAHILSKVIYRRIR